MCVQEPLSLSVETKIFVLLIRLGKIENTKKKRERHNSCLCNSYSTPNLMIRCVFNCRPRFFLCVCVGASMENKKNF